MLTVNFFGRNKDPEPWFRTEDDYHFVYEQYDGDFDITIFKDYWIDPKNIDHFKVNSKYKIALLIEPRELNFDGIINRYDLITQIEDRFDLIFTHDEQLLERNPNKYRLYFFGGTWIWPKEVQKYNYKKTEWCSFIASNKTIAPGHIFRNKCGDMVIKNFKKCDLYGDYFLNPFENKLDALSSYKYSIVVENSFHPYYFTEKLIDCFMTGTIPIYHGANIVENGFLFNPEGIIVFKTEEELYDILTYYANDKLYKKQKDNAIKDNFILAKNYLNLEDYIINYCKNLLLK